MQSLSIAATGMMAQQLNVEVISDNIANMSTSGFKRQRAEYNAPLYQNLSGVDTNSSDAGTLVPADVHVRICANTGSVYRIMTQGNFDNTENKLDVAIQGRGWFRVELPSGEDAYTRAGSFQISPDGQLVTADGYTLAPGINIPPEATDITISRDGQVQVTISGQTESQVVGQIELSTFSNDAGLDPLGDNLFIETAASGAPTVGIPANNGVGSVLQGFLETSNVNA